MTDLSVLADLDERDQRVLDVLEDRGDEPIASVELASASLLPVGEVREVIGHLQSKHLVSVAEDADRGELVSLRRDELQRAVVG